MEPKCPRRQQGQATHCSEYKQGEYYSTPEVWRFKTSINYYLLLC